MPIVCISDIDDERDIRVELNNKYELRALFNVISPIVQKLLNEDDMAMFRVGVETYERLDLYDLTQFVFMQIYHAIMQVCQDKKDLLGRYAQELKSKLEADPRFRA